MDEKKIVGKIHGNINISITSNNEVVKAHITGNDESSNDCKECVAEGNIEELVKDAESIINNTEEGVFVISKTFKADIGHFVPTQIVPGFESKCRRLHGHSIKITPVICGTINETTRMVLDYTYLAPIKEFIDKYIDHHFLLPMPLLIDAFGDMATALSHLQQVQDFFNTMLEWCHGETIDLSKGYVILDNFTGGEVPFGMLPTYADDNTILIKYGSFAIVNAPSTTAEDMSAYFTKVFRRILDIVKIKYRKYISEDVILYKVVFQETDNTEAMLLT